MNPGEHTYLYLEDSQQQCLSGYLKEKDEEIFVTSDSDEEISLGMLRIQALLDGNETNKFETQKVGNILTIKFVFDSVFFTDVLPFELCLSVNNQTDGALALMAFQNSEVNLVHSDT